MKRKLPSISLNMKHKTCRNFTVVRSFGSFISKRRASDERFGKIELILKTLNRLNKILKLQQLRLV